MLQESIRWSAAVSVGVRELALYDEYSVFMLAIRYKDMFACICKGWTGAQGVTQTKEDEV